MERAVISSNEYKRPHKLRLDEVKLVSLPGDTDEYGPDLTQRDLDEALSLDEFVDRVTERIMEIRQSRRFQ